MSKLRSINTAIWNDVWFEELDPEQKLLFIYLITNEKTNMLGVYEISIRKISFDTAISSERVSKALKEFEKRGKIRYECDCIILLNYLKHQNYNFNMKKSAIDCYNELKQPLKIENQQFIDRTEKGFEILCKGFGMVRKIEIEEEIEIEKENKDISNETKVSEQTNNLEPIINPLNYEKEIKETKAQKTIREKREFIEALEMNGAFDDYAEEYVNYRIGKKLSVSKIVLNKFLKESQGLNINEVIEVCMSKGWQGFERSWYDNLNNANNNNQKNKFNSEANQQQSVEKIGRLTIEQIQNAGAGIDFTKYNK